MSTEAQLKAISNSELASGNQIPALKHRTVNNAIIEEMYDAQSRGDILAGVQTAVSIASGDQVLVIRSGQAYLLDSTEFGFVDALADLTDVSIPAPANDQVLAYNTATSKWEAKDVNNLANVVSISGNATTNALTKFTGTSSIGDSIISDNGSTVNIAGDLSVNNDLTVGTINSGTSSDFVKGDGSLDSTTYQDTSEKSQANGYAALDSGAKIPLANLPDSILGQVTYQGTWAASTNTPTLANPPASTTKGEYYVASDDGTQFGIDFQVGDWIISNGTAWEKVDNTDAVTSVFGRLGNVVANAGDYDAFYVNLDGAETITGEKTFDNDLTVNGKISLNDGGDSVFIGKEAGLNDDGSTNRTVGVGYEALQSNTTGFNNTAIGYRALQGNITGVGNTANGNSALRENSTANFNTAFGNLALQSNTTGEQNTAVGHVALEGNKTGDGNTAIGYQAGFSDSNFEDNETGNDSVFLGSFTRPLNDGETNQIVIGFGTTGNGSNTVTIGNNFIVETILKGVISGDGSGLTNLDYNNISNPPTLPTDFVSKANGGTFEAPINVTDGDAIVRLTSNSTSGFIGTSTPHILQIRYNNSLRILVDNSLITHESNTQINGDLTVDTDTLFVDASANRVGIGTDSPRSNLSASSSSGAIITLENSSVTVVDGDSLGKLNFYSNDTSSFASGVRASINGEIEDNFGDTALVFSTAGYLESETERMRIDSTGNVGIGTDSPWEAISVPFNESISLGSSSFPLSISRSSSGNLVTTISDGYDLADTRIDFKMRAGSANENVALSILGSGNVGIGTENPSAKLHVDGDAEINGDLAVDTDTLFVDAVNDVVNINGVSSVSGRTLHVGGQIWANTANDLGFRLNGDSGMTRFNGTGLALQTNNTNRITIDGSGNVSVNGNTTISGDITASGDAIFGGIISTNNGTNEWELRRAVNEFGLTLFTDRYIWVTIDGVNYALALYSNATFPS